MFSAGQASGRVSTLIDSYERQQQTTSLPTPPPISTRFLRHRQENPSESPRHIAPDELIEENDKFVDTASELLSSLKSESSLTPLLPPADLTENVLNEPRGSQLRRSPQLSGFRLPLATLGSQSRELKPTSSYIPLQELGADGQRDAPLAGGPTPPASSLTRSVPRQGHHHKPTDPSPVGATVLFSPSAAPVSLPEVDEHLERLPEPDFSTTGSNVFPPLELLKAVTLTDLKTNRVPPAMWKDRNTIFNLITTWVLGLTGSSAVAAFYSLQGVYDSVQVFALVLTSVVRLTSPDTADRWRKLILGTVPNLLALNFSVLTQSVIFFIIFQLCALALVVYFYYSTIAFIEKQPVHEGVLELPESAKGKGWSLLLTSFVLISLYLPVSTITMHALVWTDDFWAVPNPYLNSTIYPPELSPLGPTDEYRDPLDFCYTTTMRKDSLNWAPLLIIISIFSLGSMTIYFPIRLWSTLRQSLPTVDPFTELGRRRTETELDHQYQRMLARDTHPLSFLYNDFRRKWGPYKALYLVLKLIALLTVAVIDPNNCLFRGSAHNRINVIRQGILLAETVGALILQSTVAPFIDPTSNASEWTSRAGYVATSFVGLLVALNVNGSSVLDGPVLYVIYAINYGLNLYFACIGTSWLQLVVKKLRHRLDFSVDMFSPRLDISANSVHVRRRIQHESISTLLLASPECRMPQGQKMLYSQAPKSEWPPYLMDFSGSPAERHAENLKILRDVGMILYKRGAETRYGDGRKNLKDLQRHIEKTCIGPDAFWYPETGGTKRCSDYFGHAWWIPFPPTLVIRYDRGGTQTISSITTLQSFVAQNESPGIMERRSLRMALRALDHQVVAWPYEHSELVGAAGWSPFGGRRFKARQTTLYQACTFEIKRNGVASFNDLNLGSGFNIEMRYAPNVLVDGTVIGLDDDFDLTPPLARFLLLNRKIIGERTGAIIKNLEDYRRYLRRMAQWKRDTLSYRFLVDVYDQLNDPDTLTGLIRETESDERVLKLATSRQDAFVAIHERVRIATRSRATTWWFILWDDIWRQNNDAINAMRTHESDFNPRYPGSIAYRPLPRAVLEAFLSQRGMAPASNGFITAGFLNKVYVRLSQIIFKGESKIIHTHIGDHSTDLDVSEVRFGSHVRSSTLGTGGGTDHDEDILVRPDYLWEGVYKQPMIGSHLQNLSLGNRMALWFGITPIRRRTFGLYGIGFDVELSEGHYIPVHEHHE